MALAPIPSGFQILKKPHALTRCILVLQRAYLQNTHLLAADCSTQDRECQFPLSSLFESVQVWSRFKCCQKGPRQQLSENTLSRAINFHLLYKEFCVLDPRLSEHPTCVRDHVWRHKRHDGSRLSRSHSLVMRHLTNGVAAQDTLQNKSPRRRPSLFPQYRMNGSNMKGCCASHCENQLPSLFC